MKKEIFGIAATMLLVGTMALMSCSDDCVFGYDEEWDDMIPRSEIPRTKGEPANDAPYEWKGGECAVVVIAETCFGGAKDLKYSQWSQIAIALSGSVDNYNHTFSSGFSPSKVKDVCNGFGASFSTVCNSPSKSTVYTALDIDPNDIGVRGRHAVGPNIVLVGGHFMIATGYIVERNDTEKIECRDFNESSKSYSNENIVLTDNSFSSIIY